MNKLKLFRYSNNTSDCNEIINAINTFISKGYENLLIVLHSKEEINIDLFNIINVDNRNINIIFVKWYEGKRVVISGIEADGLPAIFPDYKGLTFYLEKYGQCINILYVEKRPYIIGGYGYQKLV